MILIMKNEKVKIIAEIEKLSHNLKSDIFDLLWNCLILNIKYITNNKLKNPCLSRQS